jgi:hypothetical protein
MAAESVIESFVASGVRFQFTIYSVIVWHEVKETVLVDECVDALR